MLKGNHQVPGGSHLVAGCVQVLEQGLALLERVDDSLYAGTDGLPLQSGVGGHFRHCLDFYQSFLAGAASGRIDYSRRERDALVALVLRLRGFEPGEEFGVAPSTLKYWRREEVAACAQ